MTIATRIVFSVLIFLQTISVFAQPSPAIETGLPANSVFHGSDIDVVNLQNGNLHIDIPLLSVAQRGGSSLTWKFLYDSAIWQKVWTIPQGSGRIPPPGHYVVSLEHAPAWSVSDPFNWTAFYSGTTATCTSVNPPQPYSILTGWVIIDPEGTLHPLPLRTESPTTCFGQTLRGPTLDGSGITYDSTTQIVTLKDGTQINVQQQLRDPNGNLSTRTADTLNRNLVTVNNGSNFTTYTVTDSNGQQQVYRVDFTTITLTPDLCQFGANNTGCIQNPTSAVVPTKLTLPNQTAYLFTWNNQSPGQLARLDLPTGGFITYTYGDAYYLTLNGRNPATYTGRSAVTSRTVNSGGVAATSSYSGFTGQFPPTSVTVTDPIGNVTTHSFSTISAGSPAATSSSFYETQVSYSDSAGHVLRTISKSYTGEPDPINQSPSGGELLVNVREISETTTLDPGQPSQQVSQTQTDFETFQYSCSGSEACPGTATRLNPIEKREYSYGSSTPGPLLRRTDYTYLHSGNSTYTNLNIVDRITSITTYDGSGNRLAQTNYEFDNYSHANQPMTGSGAVQHSSSFSTAYATRGNETAISRWRNTDNTFLTTTNQYDDAGNLISSIDAMGNKVSYSFADSWSNTTCAPTTGPGVAYVTRITNALNQSVSKQYNSCTASVASTTDPNSQTTSLAYDSLDRLIQTNYPDTGQISFCYSDNPTGSCYNSSLPLTVTLSELISSSPSMTRTDVGVYDGLGRLVETKLTSDPEGTVYTRTSFDLDGRTNQIWNATRCDPFANPSSCSGESTFGFVTYNYDALGRTTQTTEQDNSVVSTAYAGNTVTVTDEAGHQRQSVSDPLGRLTSVFEDPGSSPHLNYETDYSYDAVGNLLTVSQKGGDSNSADWRTRNFTYDSLSRLTQAVNPESGTINYAYDANGNVTTKTAPAPNQTGSATVTTTYSYDALDRLKQKSYSDGSPTVTFQYDTSNESGASNDIGRRTYASVISGTTLLYQRSQPAYDPMGRLLLEYECAPDSCSQNRYSVAYAYDFTGHETSITAGFPGAGSQTQTNTFNAAGHLTAVNTTLTAFPVLSNAKYTPLGAAQSAGIGPSMVENWGYNKRGWPSSITAAPTGQASFYSLGLGYFPNGNVSSANDSVNGNWTYTYDNLNRLSTAVASNVGEGCTFGYDPWGNRTFEAPGSGSCYNVPFAFTGKNQAVGYAYDAAGNQLGDGVHVYTYDAENRIQTVDGTTTQVYDADGRRVGKNTANGFTAEYIFDQDGRELAQLGVGGNLVRGEIYASALHVATYNNQGLYFTFEDQLGTERIRRNADSSPLETCTNLPFGDGQQCSGTDVSALHFTGKERDSESGLDMFGARYYGSSLGRFMTPDWAAKPITVPYAKFGDPQTLNLYAYVENEPLNRIDADGHQNNQFDPVPQVFDCNDRAACDAQVAQGQNRQAEKAQIYKAQNLTDKAKAVGRTLDNAASSVSDFLNEHPLLTLALTVGGSFEKDEPAIEEAVEEAATAAETEVQAVGQEIGTLFRSGGSNPGNLTTREGEEALSFRDSLSNPIGSSANPVFKPGSKFIAVDSSKLPAGTAVRDNLAPGHVSVTATPEQIKNAIIGRGKLPQ